MKKYLYFVIPIIILLIIVVCFIWLYPNKNDENELLLNDVINETPDANNENLNIIESENASPEVLENEKSVEPSETSQPEKDAEVIVKETTSKITSTSTSSSSASTNTSSKAPSTSNKESTTQSTKKEEPKAEEKKEETQTSPKEDVEQPIQKQESITPTDNKSEDVKKEETVVRCTNNNNHGMSVGNTDKWFSNKDEAIAYYKSEIKYWGDWWENTSVDDTEADATYKKNCPSGYEVWSCMYCGKWTINFYYRQ